MTLRDAIDVDDGAETAAVVDSYGSFLYGAYRVVSGRYFRPIGEAPFEADGYYVATINETIDASVFKRWQEDPTYRPEELKTWASQVKFDLETAHADVRADDPTLPMKR